MFHFQYYRAVPKHVATVQEVQVQEVCVAAWKTGDLRQVYSPAVEILCINEHYSARYCKTMHAEIKNAGTRRKRYNQLYSKAILRYLV